MKLWDLANGHELLTYLGHSDHVRRVAFSPDGERIARLPEKPQNPFGRPLFQNLLYSDTPSQPLVPLTFHDAAATPGKRHTYRIIAVNTSGLESSPSAPVTTREGGEPAGS
mgnify:CR=1 FL=1